ncbi:MAG: SDR family oxidoreductase [Bacteroidota bacterium]|nr:SDR family oxidoreductase [Candidatus Kapabacteria bacterium]MDW8219053.1 SDR family oxidoreductase [Bacteroidota bacterium]
MQLHEFERGLQGRVAIVTGAAVGNGRAFCERLAEEGAHIVIADIADASETVQTTQTIGTQVLSLRVDATNPQDVHMMAQEVLQHFGRIDILVHNVGKYEEEPFELLSFEQWRHMLELNLNSLFLTTKAVLPAMKERGFGRIIALSSDTVWLGTPYLTHYVTAKMGVIGFIRSLASEVGKYGITANAVTVGLTAIQRPEQGGRVSSSILEHILPTQSVHRADEPHDIANVVAFLALPASGIINGQTINVDGGVARH